MIDELIASVAIGLGITGALALFVYLLRRNQHVAPEDRWRSRRLLLIGIVGTGFGVARIATWAAVNGDRDQTAFAAVGLVGVLVLVLMYLRGRVE